MKKILILFVLVVSVILGTPNTKTTVTSIKNSVTVSVPVSNTVSKTVNTSKQSSNKTVTELQLKIEKLEQRLENYEKVNWTLERTQKDIEKLETKIDNREGLVYNVDQIYASANDFYKTSFDDLKTLMYEFLGLVITVLIGIKIIGTWELNNKLKDLEKIKEALEKLEDDVKAKHKQLDKKIADELDKIRKDVDFKLENINELSGEIKNTLNAEKENIIDEIKAKILITSDWGGGKTENMFSSYDKSKKIDEEESKEMKLDHYKNLVNSQNYDEAVLGYENIIKNSKNKAELYEAYNGLGEIYKNQKRYEESLINYKKALMNIEGQTIDNRITLYNQLSHVCYMSNRYDEALRYKEIAYELNPNTSDEYLLSSLSDLYERQNNKEKAIKMLEQIKSKNSEKSLIYEANEKIANIYSTFKDYEKAIEIYEDLLDETKNLYTHNLPILYFRMGYNYYMASKYKEALVNLKKIDKNSDYYEIGQSYIEEIKKKS